MRYYMDLPNNITEGDIKSAKGAIIDASTDFVDWEKLYEKDPSAISTPGTILLAIAYQLGKKAF